MDYISIKMEEGFKRMGLRTLDNSLGFFQTLTFGKYFKLLTNTKKLKDIFLSLQNLMIWRLGKSKEPITHPDNQTAYAARLTALDHNTGTPKKLGA